MKISRSLLPLLIIIFCVLSNDGMAQKRSILNGVSVKGSTGMSSVYGDFNTKKFGTISDSKFGFGIAGIKMFSPFFGIQLRYSANNLSISRADLGQQYTGQILEMGMSARIEPIAPIGKNGLRRIYPYGRFGVSNARFKAIKWDTSTQQIIQPSFGYNLDDLSNAPKESALSFPVAFGIGIRLNNKLSVEFEHSISILNTDLLDVTTGNGDSNDMFGFTNIGIRYSFNPIYQSRVPKPKNLKPENRSVVEDYEYDPVREENEEETGAIDPFKNEIPYSEIYLESIMPEHPISGDLFEILFRVHKEDYTGPATLIMNMPNGFSAIEAPLRHANLTFKDQQLKIHWSQMPIDSIITQRFHVHVDERIGGPYVLKGRIWYDQPDGSKSYQFMNQLLVINRNEIEMDDQFSNILAKQKTSSTPYSTSIVLQESAQEQKNNDDIEDLINRFEQTGQIGNSTLTGRQLEDESDLDNKIQNLLGTTGSGTSSNQSNPGLANKPTKTSTSEAELDRQIENLISRQSVPGGSSAQGAQKFTVRSGVEFRIQIGAFKSREEATALVRKYNIREALEEESHNGLFKYTVGSFNNYKEAQSFRDSFSRRTNLLSVFIVGYKNGVRQSNLNLLH